MRFWALVLVMLFSSAPLWSEEVEFISTKEAREKGIPIQGGNTATTEGDPYKGKPVPKEAFEGNDATKRSYDKDCKDEQCRKAHERWKQENPETSSNTTSSTETQACQSCKDCQECDKCEECKKQDCQGQCERHKHQCDKEGCKKCGEKSLDSSTSETSDPVKKAEGPESSK